MYHRLYRVISALRLFYVFRCFDINHQFNWVVTREQADGPLSQLRLTGPTRSTEAFDFGLLLTFNPARLREEGARAGGTVRTKHDNLHQERLKDQWRDH